MDSLKKERRWCVFSEGKKPFIGVNIGGSMTRPETWLSYEEAVQLQEENESLFKWKGFFISEREDDPSLVLCVIDVDAHKQESNPLAESILNLFSGTYIEKSPSGRGYHIICNFELSKVPRDENGELTFKIVDGQLELELYIGVATWKGLTYTGDVCSETKEITNQTEQVLEFIRLYMEDYETVRTKNLAEAGRYDIQPVDDNYILERLNVARRSKYGEKFINLYDKGELSEFGNDQSRADMYLAKRLCYWLGPYPDLIDKAFKASHLYRDKWDERRGHETYGSKTISKAIDGSEKFYEPPQRNQNAGLNWGEISPEESPDTAPENSDTTVKGERITPADILKMINEAQEDEDAKEKITVFDFQCGSGKSTAIRLKIRQVIEANNGDGLVVVTDSLDRIRDYVQPKDPELRDFFIHNADKIAIMTHDNYNEVKRTQRSAPVLIMTTQRYIYLSKERIEDLLEWENGYRSLVIVDERPMFLKQVDFSEEEIERVCSAINMGIPSEDPDKHEMYDFWKNVFSRYITESVHGITEKYATTKQNYLFWKMPWFEEKLFVRQFGLAQKHANRLNAYRNSGDFVDIYSIVRAIQSLAFDGALLGFRKMPNGTIKYGFSTLLSSIDNYRDISAKVVVLDGTANLSVEYQIYEDYIDFRSCEKYRRDLDKLYINIYRASTGRTVLKNQAEKRSAILCLINEYQKDICQQSGARPVIFSYKFLQKDFYAFCDEDHFDWFGNIKGKNDYRKAKVIIQVGLNVFPTESYFLFEIAKYPGLYSQLINMELKDTMDLILEHVENNNGFTREAMQRELLSELEQNIFRGTIRNSNSNSDFAFHLFISQMHESLIDLIQQRYGELNAHINRQAVLSEYREEQASDDMNGASTGSIFDRAVYWHDNVLECRNEYTIAKMAAGIGVTRKALADAAKPDHNLQFYKLLKSELKVLGKPGRAAIFEKKVNWQL